jgi:hypothetical protein
MRYNPLHSLRIFLEQILLVAASSIFPGLTTLWLQIYLLFDVGNICTLIVLRSIMMLRSRSD